MGRHVAEDMPDLDRLVDDACAAIGADIDSLRIPKLAGVVLGGGYGRGEGGTKEKLEPRVGVGERNALQLKSPTTTLTLSNDLDFFAVTEAGEGDGATGPIAEALKPVSDKWTARLGVDVDFAVKTPWRLKHDEERIMVQELVRGYFDVAGMKGGEMFAHIEQRPAEAIPWMEAARLMMNRGMGLLFALNWSSREVGENSSSSRVEVKYHSPTPTLNSNSSANSNSSLQRHSDFVARNINKCILGAGDARLVARHAYAWKVADRARALGDALYSAAVEWKFRPGLEPVCDWEVARECWFKAFDEVSGASCGSRSLRNAARWLVRRHSIGDLRTFAKDPVVRVLDNVGRHLRARRSPGDALMRDWKVFN